MFSTSIMTLMISCMVLALGIVVGSYYTMHRRSSKLETGLPGAFSYGLLGYIWNYVFYMFSGLFLAQIPFFRSSTAGSMCLGLVLTVVTTLFTTLSLYWGVYLTNQKQKSRYRSVTVGIGFALGKIGLDLLYPFGYSIYIGRQINAGTSQVNEAVKSQILGQTSGDIILATYKCILMFAVIVAIALIMGDYYYKDDRKKAIMSCVIVYEILMILNFIIYRIPNATVANILFLIVFTVLALYSVMIFRIWLRDEKIVVLPQEVLQNIKK